MTERQVKQIDADAGETAIVVICDEIDERLDRSRIRTQDPGLPAHITLIYPFKPMDEISDTDLELLRAVIAADPLRPVTFARTGRFPGVLYLEPEDDGRFRRLTDDLTSIWPEHPPYGGAFDDVIPHLTVLHGASEPELDRAERELAGYLPLEAAAEAAWLMTYDGEEWTTEVRLPFRDVR